MGKSSRKDAKAQRKKGREVAGLEMVAATGLEEGRIFTTNNNECIRKSDLISNVDSWLNF